MSGDASLLRLHPDRLFPSQGTERAIARRLYAATREAPVVSPHGHVEARLLAEDAPFADPTSLLVTSDHYVTRILHAHGVDLAELGVGSPGPLPEPAARRAFRLLCEHWPAFRGTPVRLWLETTLAETFGVTLAPSPGTADALYDELAARLAEPAFRPRALLERFSVAVLATTDDPCDDLAAHRSLARAGLACRVVPTFRPDRYLEVGRPGWPGDAERLGAAAGVDTGDLAGFLAALEERRRAFVACGASAADHSHVDARTDPLEDREAARIYAAALAGEATAAESTALRRHLVLEMARMSCEDGLVMMLHPGVRRNHHGPTADRFGPDTGHDIPLRIELTDALRPLLERFGTHPGFHLVVFGLDESVWSRELAPLAGFYPCLYLGSPWWFLDAPDAIGRFRSAVTETAGLAKLAGFVDDTRALCSIPARHDMARRLDAAGLARLVAEHRLGEDEALEEATALAGARARAVFKL